MTNAVRRIVIVGGGSAGWLTAAIIAAEFVVDTAAGISVTLVESPDIASVGVGEGTWPSMRDTLRRIGVSETDFLLSCDASFKQGSRFVGWATGDNDAYYHPFTVPAHYGKINLARHWHSQIKDRSFVDAVCPQGTVCDHGLAPKQIATPEYAFNLNYGYHLDAGKFGKFLQRHCVDKLGVSHVSANVVDIRRRDNNDIANLLLASGEVVEGDLFVDCTGFHALLIDKLYGVPLIHQGHTLFNDRALAVQVPYSFADAPIASHTLGTAQSNGWIWDIGLPSRRGVGYVYSSAHSSEETARQALAHYLEPTLGKADAAQLQPREIRFTPGFREVFWRNNCVAIGLSAGFIEPLEATALVLVELSAQMVAEQLPENRAVMEVVARRFNRRFRHHWNRIIDFLKLHYVLSRREDSPYWIDHRRAESVPDSLTELLELWQLRPPWVDDSVLRAEMFPSASLQYVLYGMRPDAAVQAQPRRRAAKEAEIAATVFRENRLQTQRLLDGLSSNRNLLEQVRVRGFGSADIPL